MTSHKLYDVSDKLMQFVLHLNRHLFKPDEIFKGLDIPPSHVKVIYYLSRMGPTPVSQIGKDLMISKPNMTPIIDKLINLGLVHRYCDPNDRRILRVENTEKASNLFRSHQECMKAKISSKLSLLGEDDLETVDDCLHQLYEIFSNMK